MAKLLLGGEQQTTTDRVFALVQSFQQTVVHRRDNENTSRRPDVDVPSTSRNVLSSSVHQYRTRCYSNGGYRPHRCYASAVMGDMAASGALNESIVQGVQCLF